MNRNSISNYISKYTIFEIVVILCLFVNILHTHQEIMHFSRMHHAIYPSSHQCFLLFEGFSIYFLSFIIPKRRQNLLLYLYFIATIVLWINVAYSRYFDTYMPFTLYGEFNNLKGLQANIIDAFEWSDLYFVVTSIITIFAYRMYGKTTKPKHGYGLTVFFACLLMITFINHYHSVKKDHDHLVEHFKELNDQRTVWDIMIDRRRMMENTEPKISASYYGIGLTLFLNGMNSLFKTERFHFTNEEIKTIEKYMKSSEYPLPKDSIKNLIFILVESLSSYPINKSFDGIELTPNINKLLSEAYYNPNMISEAQLGESSDGQFIYLTGLLPLKNSVTINEISANTITTFVSLAKNKYPNLHSQMTIPTEKDSWSQESMCRKYGIDTLFSKENYHKEVKEDWMNDQQLFEYASYNDQHLKSPFISIILTSSMHSPYIKSYEKYDIKYPADFSSELKHYLDNVHYMDKYLGKYLESLKQYPWYDQCTIILTADHKPNAPKLNMTNEHPFTSLPLIILHPSKNLYGIMDIKPIAQSSIFPHILDIFHLKSKWKGVGKNFCLPDSILKSEYEQKRNEFQQLTSDYIINKYYLR